MPLCYEQAAQMGGLFVSAGVIEALMGQRNIAAGESGQQRLDLWRRASR